MNNISQNFLPKEETKYCIWCKHHIAPSGSLSSACKKCLEQSRERPFWELKTEQDKKQNIKQEMTKSKPKFKRKLTGFLL